MLASNDEVLLGRKCDPSLQFCKPDASSLEILARMPLDHGFCGVMLN